MNPETINAMTPALQVGDKLVHFQVQEQLASGGMGIVWRGYDPLLNRHVAIKQIASADMIDEIYRQRFRTESELHKRVSTAHKNLVDIIDCVDDPRGLFIVMEFVEGMSLERGLSHVNGPLEVLSALKVVRDVAQGLAAIHEAGIVHRDLKPGNVLLPMGDGPAKVCDFGLATLLAEQDTMTMGTAQYMAPELFGDETVDGRADIYALGMMAYEMLAGRPAFDQAFKAIKRDQRNQAMRWMKWHTNPRVTAPPLHSLNPRVPEILSDLVARMMAKDPGQRIASAPQLLEAIGRHFTKSAAVAQAQRGPAGAAAVMPPGQAAATATPTAPLPKKSKLPLILDIIIGVQLAGFGGYLFYVNHKKTQQVDKQLAAANGQFDDARKLFDQARNSTDPPEDRASVYAQAQNAFTTLAQEWGDSPKLGLGSMAYALLCSARSDMFEADRQMVDGNFAAAADVYAKIRKSLAKADALNLPPNATTLIGELDDTKREVASRADFVDHANEIATAIKGGDFDKARRMYRDVRDVVRRVDQVLRANEKAKLQELGDTIAGQEQQAEIDAVDQRAASLQGEGKLAEAAEELRKAQEYYGHQQKFADRLSVLTRDMSFNKALSDAQAAEARGDTAAAVTAYVAANDIKPTDTLSTKISTLRSAIALADGQKLQADGNIAAAVTKYNEALGFDASNARAKELLAQIGMANDKSSAVKAGDTAARAGDYEQAINQYKRALDLAPDPDTQGKLNAAIVRLHVKKAQAAFSALDLDAANSELAAATKLAPDDAEAGGLLKKIDDLQKLQSLIAEGDALRANSQYTPAKNKFEAAIKHAKAVGLNPKPAEERKFNTEFDHLVAQAKAAMDVSQWGLARGLLKTAQKMRDTEQIQKMLVEVNDHEPEK
ncbi:MAG: protein kinase [Planctomycetes bacterium]|nr:protein kinase [Planctomycetota bacterium]